MSLILHLIEAILPHLLTLFVLQLAPISIFTYFILFVFNFLWKIGISSEYSGESESSIGEKVFAFGREYSICLGLIVLLGASLKNHPLECLYLALHIAFRLWPSQYFDFKTISPYDWFHLLFAWCSPMLLLLDWNGTWQMFPYPVIVGCELACIVKKLPACFRLQETKGE